MVKRITYKKTVKSNKNMSPIPQKLHFIWLGPKQPPYLKKFMKTFEKHAPGYEQMLWSDDDITKKNFPITYDTIQKVGNFQGEKIKEYTNQKTMLKTKGVPYTYSKYAQVSDLMRYEIVNTHGGYYFDANMFLLKDISKLFNRKEKFVGCNELGPNMEKSPILSNSFFGAVPKSPVLKRILNKKFLDSIDLRTLDVDFETGPGALRGVLDISKDSYYIFDSNTFYPYILPWTADGDDHPLRKSSKPKCTGNKRTKKRTLKMKDNLWLEFPCKKYKGVYGIKLWESGGSWSRPNKWYEKEGSRLTSHYQGSYDNVQKGGVVPCVPCAAAVIGTGPVGMGIAAVGACAYGAKKGFDYYDKCKSKKKSKGKGKGTKKIKSKGKKTGD
jgi:hypothetical protein